MKILQEPQGSTAWSLARAGLITASDFDALITPKFEVRKGQGVKTYLYEKLAGRIFGYDGESGGTFAMDQGKVMETMARPWYAFQYGVEIKEVGLCVSDDGKTGCSPDGLIGDDCGIEIKCPTAPKHLEYLLGGKVPDQYLAQVHFSMYVTNRPRWVFVSYSPHMPKLVVNVLRSPEADAAIAAALAEFIPALDAAEARVRGMMESQTQSRQ